MNDTNTTELCHVPHQFLVFDIDGTREAARQRALPKAEELPAPQRRLKQVCAAGQVTIKLFGIPERCAASLGLATEPST